MAIEVRKKQGDSDSALFFAFSKRVKRSGVLKEARKRAFRGRNINRNKRRVSALHREKRRKEVERARKLGLI